MCCSASGVIHVSYAYVKRPQDSLQEPPEVFHTRQLSYPVLVTVYHMLECHSMDILPYSDTISAFHGNTPPKSADSERCNAFLNIGDAADWCIFCVEVRKHLRTLMDAKETEDTPAEVVAGPSGSRCSDDLDTTV